MNRLIPLLLLFFAPFVLHAQEANFSEDAWYECYYTYEYTTVNGEDQTYDPEREEFVVVILNGYRHIFRTATFEDDLTLVFGDPISLERQDDDGNCFSSANNYAFSADYSHFVMASQYDMDVYILEGCELLEGPLPFDPEEDTRPEWPRILLYVLLAILPAALLMVFILWRDRLRPEPAKELILAFCLGILTLPIALVLEIEATRFGLSPIHHISGWDCFKAAFLGAAIPEEFSKLLILWIFFKWRKKQNEFMDGIVYAVCIGLAFATGENIKYILNAMTIQAVSNVPVVAPTGIARALTAVPCHFSVAVLMGFFYSFYLFSPTRKKLALALAFLVPVLFHGLYDFFAFLEDQESVWEVVFSFAFFGIFFFMAKLGVKAIRTALKLDQSIPTP